MAVKTPPQSLLADPATLESFVRDDWNAMSHYERLEFVREAGALPRADGWAVLGNLFERLDSPVSQAQILSAIDFSEAGGELPAFLETALGSANSRVRANAIEALARVSGQGARALIRRHLNDEDNRVRANVSVALWLDEGERPAVLQALEEMGSSGDPWIRASAVFAAGKILDPAFDPLLERALADEYEPAVVGAVKALAQRRHPAIGERASALLAQPGASTALQHAAVEALVTTGARDPGARDALLAALGRTGDRELQDKILAALEQQEDASTAGKILEFLEQLPVEGFPLCQRLLGIVAQTGGPDQRGRLDGLARGKLVLYTDLIDRAKREIGKRHRKWW